MRGIKFRAWCETTKKIYQITDIDFSNYVANGVCYGDWQEFSTSMLLPYIGLKDKNDTEIYKDDLLQDDKDRLFQVVEDSRISHTGYLMCCIKNKSEKDHIQIGSFYEFYSWLYPDNALENIGNIYENLELIENEKS